MTDSDRETARKALVASSWTADIESVAAALAEERERERATWNPMIGRVIQVAQALEREAPEIAERINRAIEGAE